MQSIRLAASAFMTLILLGLAVLLYAPSFRLPALDVDGGLAAGGLPQFCIVAGAVLAVIIFVKDYLAVRRTGAISGPSEFGETAEPKRVLLTGLAALVLLSAFVAGWALAGFLPAAIGFMFIASLLLLPAEQWNKRSFLIMALTGLLFGTGIWALFVYVLQVPLR